MSEDLYIKKPRIKKWFLPKIKPYCKGKVLDIGCGDGRYLEHFSQESIGIDMDKRRLAVAKEKGLNVVEHDLNNGLKFEAQSFDTLFCSHVLEHVKCPFYILEEFKRVLKPDGFLVLGLPSPNSLVDKVVFREDYYKNHKGHIYAFKIRDIENFLDKTSFFIVKLIVDDLLFPSVISKIINFNYYTKKIFENIAREYWIIAKIKNE